MSDTTIDKMYADAKAVLDCLEEKEQWSLRSAASDHLRKALLLASASYFEHRLTNDVLEFVRERTNGCQLTENLIRTKAIDRQYHSWFDWNTTNANKFFGLFGADFRAAMARKITVSKPLQEAVAAFMELGSERNSLVHQNYITFPMEKTLDEVFALYKKALEFVDVVPSFLRDFVKPEAPPAGAA